MNGGLARYIASRALSGAATQMQGVALAWIVYERTSSAFNLGLIGLAWFLPSILLMVPAGQAADRFDRRLVAMVGLAAQAAGAAILFLCTRGAGFSILLVYAVVLAVGAGRAFSNPSFQSLLPEVVGPEALPQAVAASSSANQAATIAGPALGGLIFAWVGGSVFLVLAVLHLAALVVLIRLPLARPRPSSASRPASSPWAGLAYVRTNRLLLGSITLDLFAVLLGGVTAILPIFARDVLHVGPAGLGLLRSGPAIGALLVGLALVYMPLRRRAGAIMLWAIAGYGAATIVFGLSTEFWLSLGAMVALGAFDMVSVVVRQTLVQAATPDAMRGRVSAVNSVFVGASNHLGGFESGALASLIGAAPSAIVGGVGALAVVMITAWLIPEIGQVESLQELGLEATGGEAAAKASATAS